MPCMSRTCPERPRHSAGRGFTLVSVLFVLVVLAALGAAMATLSQRQHMGAAAELQSVQALQAARAGLEWAVLEVLRNPAPPAAAPGCFAPASFDVEALPGFTITVQCSRTPANGSLSDGATALVFYALTANACNAPSAGSCPAAGALAPTYVERQLAWTVVR